MLARQQGQYMTALRKLVLTWVLQMIPQQGCQDFHHLKSFFHSLVPHGTQNVGHTSFNLLSSAHYGVQDGHLILDDLGLTGFDVLTVLHDASQYFGLLLEFALQLCNATNHCRCQQLYSIQLLAETTTCLGYLVREAFHCSILVG